MTQSVELLLNEDLDDRVRAQWRTLAEAGLPSQARHEGETNRPHITMAIAGQVTEGAEAVLAGLGRRLPVAVRLGGLICFGGRALGRQVLARIVVPNLELLQLQAETAGMFRDQPGTGANHQPGAWTPHVTLGMNLRTEQVGPAIAALGDFTELDGEAVAVRRWDSEGRRAWLVA